MIALLFLCLLSLSVAQPSTSQCSSYCMGVNSACTGSLAQFPSPDSHNLCMASCMFYPLNATLSTSGDSYDCRMYHLSVANTSAANATIHCNHTGFNGGPNTCGMFCESYCDNVMNACNGTNALFTSRDKCMQECSYYPRNNYFNLSSPDTPTGNSIDCRAWHSQVAAASTGAAINVHCGHASPQGGEYCGTDCDNYCDNVMTVCTDSNNMGLRQWSSRSQCMEACETFPMVNQTAYTFLTNLTTIGNSYPCRKYHASVAGQSSSLAQVHCVHTGPLGGSGVCGTECEGLCNLVTSACSSIDSTTCMSMCASLQSSNTTTTMILDGKVSKGTTGCATYYALQALEDSSMCSKASSALNATSMGGDCLSTGSGAALVKASWTVLAVVLLAAIGFTSS